MEVTKSYTLVVDGNELPKKEFKKNFKKKSNHNKNNKTYNDVNKKQNNKQIEKPVNKRKVNYIVKLNERYLKSGSARIDFSKLHEFELELIKKFKTNSNDNIEILFR